MNLQLELGSILTCDSQERVLCFKPSSGEDQILVSYSIILISYLIAGRWSCKAERSKSMVTTSARLALMSCVAALLSFHKIVHFSLVL